MFQSANEFILKVASRCNINCDYCYEYNLGDDTWKSQSKIMSQEIFTKVVDRMSDHAIHHQINHLMISFHGGEPLLIGHKRLYKYAKEITEKFSNIDIEVQMSIQTNGILIDEEFCKIFNEFNIQVGISLDGPENEHNLHRKDHIYSGTYQRVINGINTLRQFAKDKFSGILCVIDINNDPIVVFDHLASFEPPLIDLLLPLSNWDKLPYRNNIQVNEYAEWYLKIWHEWLNGKHQDVKIRFFENIISGLVGMGGIYESMSVKPVRILAINSNGEYEGVDTLKSTASGVQKTGLNVKGSSVDEVINLKLYQDRQNVIQNLCEKCGSCDVRNICAGGYIPNRYSAENGFDNTSVYCDDLFEIVVSIKRNILDMINNDRKLF